ncbi:MAG: hypothetical protein JSW23_07150, partial [Planctomycetota bacterium]
EKFFIIALVVLNVPLMVLLYCKYDYMSRRHTLPLVIFTIFYASAGLQAMGAWLQGKFSKEVEKPSKAKTGETTWFLALLAIGISICIPRLLTPIRSAKKSFREVAQWLATHTGEKDIVAVPDIRISFYAQRKGVICKAGQVPKKAHYIVREFKSDEAILPGQLDNIEHEYVDQADKNRIIIYRRRL